MGLECWVEVYDEERGCWVEGGGGVGRFLVDGDWRSVVRGLGACLTWGFFLAFALGSDVIGPF